MQLGERFGGENLSGVYRIQCLPTKRVYYGSTSRFYRRFREHKWLLTSNKHRNIKLQRAWNKYGADKFRVDVLRYCSTEIARDIEQEILNNIDLRKSLNICKAVGKLGTRKAKAVFLHDIIDKTSTRTTRKRVAKLTGLKGQIRDMRLIQNRFIVSRSVGDLETAKRIIEEKRQNAKQRYFIFKHGDFVAAVNGSAAACRVIGASVGAFYASRSRAKQNRFSQVNGFVVSTHSSSPTVIDKRYKSVKQINGAGVCVRLFSSLRNAAVETGLSYKRLSDAACGRTKMLGGYKWEYVAT